MFNNKNNNTNFLNLFVFFVIFIILQNPLKNFLYSSIVLEPFNYKILFFLFKKAEYYLLKILTFSYITVKNLNFCPTFLNILRQDFSNTIFNLFLNYNYKFNLIFYFYYWLLFLCINFSYIINILIKICNFLNDNVFNNKNF